MPSSPPKANPPGNTRIGDGTQPPRRPLLPRWVRLLLYPLFALLLLIPTLRRLRRETRRWNTIRALTAAGAIAACAGGLFWSAWWLLAAGIALLAMTWVAKPSVDPDRERDIQRRHNADYLLNGGRLLSSGPGGLKPGSENHLLLRGTYLLFVPVGSEDIQATINLAAIQEILVGGAAYRPVYISEAKDPPVREKSVDRKAAAVMTLVLADGAKVEFAYQGAFSKHLAETAAHAIYSVRQLTAHGVGGQSPEVFHVVRR